MLGVMLFFFNDTATTEIYTLSLHDALPIWQRPHLRRVQRRRPHRPRQRRQGRHPRRGGQRLRPRQQRRRRSEEHTSELQSRQYLVCRLLLEKKKTNFTFMSSRITRHTITQL